MAGTDRQRVRAHELRAEGLSVRKIAAELRIPRSTAGGWLTEPAPHVEPVPNIQTEDGRPVAGAGPGNLRSVTHGAQSDALVIPEARQLVPDIMGAHPHLDARRDGPAVARYAVTLARIARVYRWLDAQADPVFADEAGVVHAVYDRLRQWERDASRQESELALSPLTRTKLGLDQLRGHELTHALAGMAEAAQLGRRRLAALDAAETTDDGRDAA